MGGNDTLDGGADADILNGGGDNDTFINLNDGSVDQVSGGDGVDTAGNIDVGAIADQQDGTVENWGPIAGYGYGYGYGS